MNATYQLQPGAGTAASSAADETLPEAGAPSRDPRGLGYVLTLYVASLTPRSVAAIKSVKGICEKHLSGRYSLEVVDIYERPSVAKQDDILAAPTLIRRLPLPLRRLIGDMGDEHRVMLGLDLGAPEPGIMPHD
jgi:circadian clock protein KaiB